MKILDNLVAELLRDHKPKIKKIENTNFKLMAFTPKSSKKIYINDNHLFIPRGKFSTPNQESMIVEDDTSSTFQLTPSDSRKSKLVSCFENGKSLDPDASGSETDISGNHNGEDFYLLEKSLSNLSITKVSNPNPSTSSCSQTSKFKKVLRPRNRKVNYRAGSEDSDHPVSDEDEDPSYNSKKYKRHYDADENPSSNSKRHKEYYDADNQGTQSADIESGNDSSESDFLVSESESDTDDDIYEGEI